MFGQVAALPSDGVPYFLFSYIGMVAWTFLSSLVTRASGSFVANQALVSKVFFPRALVPLSTLLSVLLDLAVAMVLGVVLLVVYRANPGWEVLLAPWWLLQLALLGAGLGLAFSALTVKYRDVTYVLPWLIQIGLYASPVRGCRLSAEVPWQDEPGRRSGRPHGVVRQSQHGCRAVPLSACDVA